MTKRFFGPALALAALGACNNHHPATETTTQAVRSGTLTTDAAWTVGLVFLNWGQICSGIVLTEHWILTAAHCMAGHQPTGAVRVIWADEPGGYDFLYDGQARFYPNEHYQGSSHTANDVGLVRVVDGALDLGKTGRAKLWSPATRPWASDDVADRMFFALGWGNFGQDCDSSAPKKHISNNHLLDQAGWNDAKVTTPTGWPVNCDGDSGGPWVFSRNGQLIAFALFSRYVPWPFEWDEAPMIWAYNEPWISIVSLRDGLQVTCSDAGTVDGGTFQVCFETPVTHPPDPGHGGVVCPTGKKCCEDNPDGPKCLLCIDKNKACP